MTGKNDHNGWKIDPTWLLSQIGDPAIAISVTGQVLHANAAAQSLATRLNPADPQLADLVALVPEQAVQESRVRDRWQGVAVEQQQGLHLGLELQMAGAGAIVIFHAEHLGDHDRAQAAEQMVHADKMAAIGQLAAGIAHEVNNPIGYVGSNLRTLHDYVDVLLRIVEADRVAIEALGSADAVKEMKEQRVSLDLEYIAEDLPKLLTESREGVDRVAKIVRDLKDYSRSGAGEPMRKADLISSVESTLNIASNELKYKAEIVRDFGQMPLVECRPEEISQVVLNLLMNAGHAIEEQGTITVATGADESEAWISVTDTGGGIPADKLARIFDPYFTTKPVGKGTGIGLAIAYNIIASHLGRIEVRSRPGEGTHFKIVLPIEQPRRASGN